MTNGTTYYYKAAVVNSSGTSGHSAEVSATPTAGSGPIANGTWTMTPQNATGSRVDAQGGGTTNGTKVQIWQATAGDANQQWVFTNVGGNVYKIQPSYNTALVMEVSGGGTAYGTGVDLWPERGCSLRQAAARLARPRFRRSRQETTR